MKKIPEHGASQVVKVFILLVCLSHLIPCAAFAQGALSDVQALRPEEVVVIANAASPDSLSVARYYMKRRAIPEGHLFTVNFPKPRHRRAISQKAFYEKMLRPLQHFLEKQG